MSDLYSDKLFEFTNMFFGKSEITGDIRVLQIGETCLDMGASIDEHIQVCHEITLIISGTGVLTADCEENECGVGDMQIISKGTMHSIKSNENSRLRYIHFAFDFVDDKSGAIPNFYGQCKNVLMHDDGSVRQILNMLVNEYANSAKFGDVMKSSLINMVLILIWRGANMPTSVYRPVISGNPMGGTVYRIIKYIDNNMTAKLTVNDIAKKFSYSVEHISRLFKEKTGVPLKKYITAAKMEYAQSLIAEKKCSLAEIAELMGYGSTQAFCKAFKNYTGCTAGGFRNENT